LLSLTVICTDTQIMRQIEEQSGGRLRLGPGTLYGSIQALLEGKLIEEVDRPEDSDVGQERRRYYRLTVAGRKLVRSETEKMADILRVARDRKILRGGLCLRRCTPAFFVCTLQAFAGNTETRR
jgi:DNA-binding PadR family transcriptional regulator